MFCFFSKLFSNLGGQLNICNKDKEGCLLCILSQKINTALRGWTLHELYITTRYEIVRIGKSNAMWLDLQQNILGILKF